MILNGYARIVNQSLVCIDIQYHFVLGFIIGSAGGEKRLQLSAGSTENLRKQAWFRRWNRHCHRMTNYGYDQRYSQSWALFVLFWSISNANEMFIRKKL